MVKSTQCEVDHCSQFWACRAAVSGTSTCLRNLRAPPTPHTSPEFFSSCETRTLSIPVSQHLLIPLCLLPPVTAVLSVISATLNPSHGMVPGLSLCSWLISLSIVSSRFIQVAACVRITFLSRKQTFHCMCRLPFSGTSPSFLRTAFCLSSHLLMDAYVASLFNFCSVTGLSRSLYQSLLRHEVVSHRSLNVRFSDD